MVVLGGNGGRVGDLPSTYPARSSLSSPADRERLGLSVGQMAWRLGLTIQEYRELEADELRISFDPYERIVEVCGWPK